MADLEIPVFAQAQPSAPLPATNGSGGEDVAIPIVQATALIPPKTGKAPDRVLQRTFRHLELESHTLTDEEVQALVAQGFTTGLAKAMTENNADFPLRIFLIDNSGSMNSADGHRFADPSSRRKSKIVSCTRWAEIQQTVEYHARLAVLLETPTIFRLLNCPGKRVGSPEFSICEGKKHDVEADLARAIHIMTKTTPVGVTPLSDHVRAIRANVMKLLPNLEEKGTRVAVIIATDGLPTDNNGRCNRQSKNEFIEALRSLENLPVWVVVRLCTDEDDIVEFYNNLDRQLELNLEVLDDYLAEAREIYAHNPWLNYALPLHRCRELGYHNRLFDLLDERPFTIDEVRCFLRLLLGKKVMEADPQSDWKDFCNKVSALLKKEDKQWNPISEKLGSWVDMNKLKRHYGPKGWLARCTVV